MIRNWHIVLGFLMAVGLSVPGISVGAAEPTGKDQGEISSNAVARLVISKGTTWVRSGDSGEWEEAGGNFPVAERARVSVPLDSEAKIQFRGSQTLTLRGGSEVDIRKLGEKEVVYRLRSGEVFFSLPKEDFAPVRILVPGNREVGVDSPGEYSLSTDEGLTRFHVRVGEGNVASGEGSPIPVKTGELASIGEKIRVSREDAGFLETVREPVLTEAETESGVPSSAATELRQYGEWVRTPEYGYVWRPYVEDTWEPYDSGRWTWVDPYGWTWVGYEPWGWWPYHYGWWWPSPAFGWVWCPFNSFVSVDFFFGGRAFSGHRAAFFPGNVRFIGRGRFVRWVPGRPGVVETRSNSFARNDTRLAGWNRPLERGSILVRRDGGRPVAWEGQDGSFRSAKSRAGVRSSPAGLRDTMGRGGGPDRSGAFRGPIRSSAERVAPSTPNRGFNRGTTGEGPRRGGGGSRGYSGGGPGGNEGRRVR